MKNLVFLLISLLLAAPGCQKDFTVKLAANPWLSSSLNALIAQSILENELGYRTEIIAVDEQRQWQLLASGDLHVSLEVWPSGHTDDIKKYIEKERSVELIGLLGVVGKMGWFAPAYVFQDNPGFHDWRALRDPGFASIFNDGQKNGKGYFLAGDPSWTQYDQDIIKNLGLQLQVQRLGSEKALIQAVEKACQARHPVLLYFWRPHYLVVKYDLREIKLPNYSDKCYRGAAKGLVDCDYPPDILLKIAWPGLKKMAPQAYQLLCNFNLSNHDQNALLGMVALDKLSPQEAARKWLKDNRSRWSAWITP